MAATHSVAVTFAGGRYPHRPTCSCGWATWGYLTEAAAQNVADDHKGERMKRVDPDTCPLCGRPAHDYRCGAWPS